MENEIEEEKIELKRNENTNDGWYYEHESLKQIRHILEYSLPYKYTLAELDELLNVLFERGFIK